MTVDDDRLRRELARREDTVRRLYTVGRNSRRTNDAARSDDGYSAR